MKSSARLLPCVSLLLGACFVPNATGPMTDTDGADETLGTTTDIPMEPTSPTSTITASATEPPTTTSDPTAESSMTDPSMTDTAPETTSSESTTAPTDADGDGVPDDDDNCVDIENADQSDIDSDEVGDWCDAEAIDDGERLYIPPGVSVELAGLLCYTDEVRIYGTIVVTSASAGGGALVMSTPARIWIAEGGLIDGEAAGAEGGLPSSDTGGRSGEGSSPGCGGGPGSCVGQAGAGGGYGGSGGSSSLDSGFTTACDLCYEPTVAHCMGAVGPAVGTSDGDDLSIGSGGGAAGNGCGCIDSGGRGGNGGAGILLVSAESVRIDGRITVDGEQPPADGSICGYRAGGGGGSGGGIAIAAPTIEGGATGELSARGGDGGNSPGDLAASVWGWSGGGGGGGRIKLFGTSDEFMGTTDVAGGVGGTVPAERYSFAGEPGADGSFGTATEVPPAFTTVCP
jgi:hypothetical protein